MVRDALDVGAHHFQCTSEDAAEYIGEPELILRVAIVWEFNEICQWVFIKYQREGFVICRPIHYSRGNIEEHFESDLLQC